MPHQIPTKRELLEKYRGVISNEDFDIIAADHLPTPEESRHKNMILQYLGTLNGYYVWMWRSLGPVIATIIFVGDFVGGLEAINKSCKWGFDQASRIMEVAQNFSDVPAKEYKIVYPPRDWQLFNDRPYDLASFIQQDKRETTSVTTSTTTTTTTTTPGTSDLISPGSGLIPFSNEWQYV